MNLVRINPKAKITEFAAPNRVQAGKPKVGADNAYSDRSGKFHCGVWESSLGKWSIDYTEEEFCTILEGEAIITDEAGFAETFRTGDTFVIPSGFKGTWETTKHLRKYYVIWEG